MGGLRAREHSIPITTAAFSIAFNKKYLTTVSDLPMFFRAVLQINLHGFDTF